VSLYIFVHAVDMAAFNNYGHANATPNQAHMPGQFGQMAPGGQPGNGFPHQQPHHGQHHPAHMAGPAPQHHAMNAGYPQQQQQAHMYHQPQPQNGFGSPYAQLPNQHGHGTPNAQAGWPSPAPAPGFGAAPMAGAHQHQHQHQQFGGFGGMPVPQGGGMKAVAEKLATPDRGFRNPLKDKKNKQAGSKVNPNQPPKGKALTKFLGKPTGTVSASTTPLRHGVGAGTPQAAHTPSALGTPRFQTDTGMDTTTASSHDIANRCVTVFGFNPDAPDTVLCRFQMHGTIEDRQFKPGKNWMHLKYSSRKEAAKAKNMHGHKFDDKIMIAVQPCTDVDFIGSTSSTSASTLNSTAMGPTHTTILGTPAKAVRKDKPRSLLATAAATPQSNVDTPKKDRGVLGDAMEYIFGY